MSMVPFDVLSLYLSIVCHNEKILFVSHTLYLFYKLLQSKLRFYKFTTITFILKVFTMGNMKSITHLVYNWYTTTTYIFDYIQFKYWKKIE